MSKKPKDPRSTQRKRARKVLYRSGRDYICNHCGKSPNSLPLDAPRHLRIAPVVKRTASQLEANHINKNIMDNDLANLQWLCPSCHKKADNKVIKGDAIYSDDFGFFEGFQGILE